MKLIRDREPTADEPRGGAVAIGNFDGVHLGHARIIERLIAKARQVAGPAVVFTFDPHPVRLLRPDQAPPPLTWTDRKAELLFRLGVDAMIAYPTDDALLALPPSEFFERIVRRRLDAQSVVEGPNFFFGVGRSGTIEVLGRLCEESRVSLDVVDPVHIEGDLVSSSRVRKLLSAGLVEPARRMLTEPYRLRGIVRHGAGRGARIGFPTANLAGIDTLLPGEGVYAGRVFRDRRAWPAAINVGPNPTFGEGALKIEAHLVGFSGSLYGEPLEVDFIARLRDIQRFDDAEALSLQLGRDIAAAERAVEAFTARTNDATA